MTSASNSAPPAFPRLKPMGLNGLLIQFADQLSEAANRATLAFHAAVEREGWDGVEESSTALCSVFLRFDPQHLALETLQDQARRLIAAQDWFAASLPEGRRLWRIPTVFDGPQLAEAATLAKVSPTQAVTDIAARPLRVLTLGFAPGQPYLGTLPAHWNLPRQSDLTPVVPVGALVVAVRQCVLFATEAPTGWRHIGNTAFRAFQPDATQPFLLRPGDECLFDPVSREVMETARTSDPMGLGGARAEPLP